MSHLSFVSHSTGSTVLWYISPIKCVLQVLKYEVSSTNLKLYKSFRSRRSHFLLIQYHMISASLNLWSRPWSSAWKSGWTGKVARAFPSKGRSDSDATCVDSIGVVRPKRAACSTFGGGSGYLQNTIKAATNHSTAAIISALLP